VAAATVLVAFGILPAIAVQQTLAQERAEAAGKAEEQRYREVAWAHFRKRCKEDAKETINRIIENVEAIFLIKPREKPSERDLANQYWMGDPYGYSSYEANHPVGTYLFDRSGKTISGRKLSPIKGYKYVELSNPSYQQSRGPRYLRYKLEKVAIANSVTKELESRLQPRSVEVDTLLSRYGITWEDISTREDRKYWVAGGKLTILDLQTREVIGERIGYVIDPQFGSDYQGRRAWLAVGFVSDAFCPKFENRFDRNKEFVAKVLRATAGGSDGQ
jgi:hypothetical protein